MKQEDFLNLKESIKQFTNSKDLLEYCLLKKISTGINLEFGVYSGNSINHAANFLKNEIFYGFDSFEGLPEDWRKGFEKGTFNLNGNLPAVRSNVTLVKGLFQDTLTNFYLKMNQKISFIHIDCDLYSATKFVLNESKTLLQQGTVILFDEFYGYSAWESSGEFLAWNEFLFENSNIRCEFIGINNKHEQVAVCITHV